MSLRDSSNEELADNGRQQLLEAGLGGYGMVGKKVAGSIPGKLGAKLVARSAASAALAELATPFFETKDAVELVSSPQAREDAYNTLKDITDNGNQVQKVGNFAMAPTKNMYALGRLLHEGGQLGHEAIVQSVNAENARLSTNQPNEDRRIQNERDVPPVDLSNPRKNELDLAAAKSAFEDHQLHHDTMQMVRQVLGRR